MHQSKKTPTSPTPGYRWGWVLVARKKRRFPHHVTPCGTGNSRAAPKNPRWPPIVASHPRSRPLHNLGQRGDCGAFFGLSLKVLSWYQSRADVSGLVSSPCEMDEWGVAHPRPLTELFGRGGWRPQGRGMVSERGGAHPRLSLWGVAQLPAERWVAVVHPRLSFEGWVAADALWAQGLASGQWMDEFSAGLHAKESCFPR